MKKINSFKILKWISFLFVFALFILFSYMKIMDKNINEIGLSVLKQVKKWKGKAVNLSKIERENAKLITHELWDELLKTYVTEEGKVDYKNWVDDTIKLVNYLDLLANNPPAKNWTASEQLAYWINAYNAFTVQLILRHYPLKSIKEIGGGIPMNNTTWDKKFFKIGNVPFDLNTIEHSILRVKFQEPRIHFAINCASISCPILRKEAYTAANIEVQLREQSINFLTDSTKNQIMVDDMKISKIFDWFKSDFTKRETLKGFLSEQSGLPISEKATIDFLDYDWALNE